MSTILILCLTFGALGLFTLIGWHLWLRSQRPQARCAHEMDTQQVAKGGKIVFLSTCTKCGHQKLHNVYNSGAMLNP